MPELISGEYTEWRAREDAQCLIAAKEIASDVIRLRAAKLASKKIAAEADNQARAARRVLQGERNRSRQGRKTKPGFFQS